MTSSAMAPVEDVRVLVVAQVRKPGIGLDYEWVDSEVCSAGHISSSADPTYIPELTQQIAVNASKLTLGLLEQKTKESPS